MRLMIANKRVGAFTDLLRDKNPSIKATLRLYKTILKQQCIEVK